MKIEREYLSLPIKKRIVFSNPQRVDVEARNPFLGKLEGDTHTILQLDGWGHVALVQKSRPYITGPADLMLIPIYRAISQVSELDDDEGRALLRMSGNVAHAMVRADEGKGQSHPVIAFNQQPACVCLPEKYENGVEVKTQTIDQLHFHIFLEDGQGEINWAIAGLKGEDKKDFFDILGLAFGEALIPDLKKRVMTLNNKAEVLFLRGRFPLGINIRWSESLEGVTNDPNLFSFIKFSQERLITFYQNFADCLTVDGSHWWEKNSDLRPRSERIERVSDFLKKKCSNLSAFSQRITRLLAMNIVSSRSESRQYLRLIYGPASIWIIYEDDSGCYVHLSPKVLSKGNAMESLGIWKDQFDEVDKQRQLVLDDFYLRLLENIDDLYCPQKGPLLTERGY